MDFTDVRALGAIAESVPEKNYCSKSEASPKQIRSKSEATLVKPNLFSLQKVCMQAQIS